MIDGMTAWIIEKKIYWQTAWLTLACRANRELQATLENEIYPSQKILPVWLSPANENHWAILLFSDVEHSCERRQW